MLAKNAESALAGPGCQLIRQPRQPINSETEFAMASQSHANEFIVRSCKMLCANKIWTFFLVVMIRNILSLPGVVYGLHSS